ncbi:MAG: thermonuclease family protein, partial [Armatimonadetes bacterium]|nr:thermonuclease family protein [Armatimonadota bacterium]
MDVRERDRYDRLLGYVYVRDERGREIFVNAELVREGYARVMTIPPDVKYADLFLRLEREARAARRGLWAEAADARGGTEATPSEQR